MRHTRIKTRSRRGRLAVRKTRRKSQRHRKTQRKSQCQRQRQREQRGGNFISDTLGVPRQAYVTVLPEGEDAQDAAPILIQKEDIEEAT